MEINIQNKIRWTLLIFTILILILIPYLIFGQSIEGWINTFLNSLNSKFLIGIVIGAILSIDIFAPVPSSIVSTAGGYFLGFLLGTLISLTGMTINCIIGYWLGKEFGNPISEKLVGKNELKRLENLQNKYGSWIIIISRAVPVLAETSILAAGIGHMPLDRFVILILISNLGISLVYSTIGVYSAHINSFLLAFTGAIVLPAIAMVILKIK